MKLHYFLKYILTNFPPLVLIHYKIQIFSYTQSSLNLNILVITKEIYIMGLLEYKAKL